MNRRNRFDYTPESKTDLIASNIYIYLILTVTVCGMFRFLIQSSDKYNDSSIFLNRFNSFNWFSKLIFFQETIVLFFST